MQVSVHKRHMCFYAAAVRLQNRVQHKLGTKVISLHLKPISSIQPVLQVCFDRLMSQLCYDNFCHDLKVADWMLSPRLRQKVKLQMRSTARLAACSCL